MMKIDYKLLSANAKMPPEAFKGLLLMLAYNDGRGFGSTSLARGVAGVRVTAFDALVASGLVVIDGNGAVSFGEFVKTDNSTERSLKHREKTKDDRPPRKRKNEEAEVVAAQIEAVAEQVVNEVAPCPYDDIQNLYNTKLPNFTACRMLSGERKKHMSARWKEVSKLIGKRDKETLMAFFGMFFDKIDSSDFLSGRTGNGWRPDFGWLFKPENFAKITEGKYDNR